MTPLYSNPHDRETIAFMVVAWIVSEPGRSERFLTLTGLDVEQLRSGLENPGILGAAIDFLMGHEPDLIACADAIGVPPDVIAAARGGIG
ncbi:MAG: DUF3572 domain-containing protein [Sphingobium sp.]